MKVFVYVTMFVLVSSGFCFGLPSNNNGDQDPNKNPTIPASTQPIPNPKEEEKPTKPEDQVDSYTNIGGASGSVASSLTNTNEYGEIVPEAFTNLLQDTYAYYQSYNRE